MLCPSARLFTRLCYFRAYSNFKPPFLRRPELFEGEGRWESTLRTDGLPMLRFESEGAKSAMARNLHIGVAMKVRSVRDALHLR